MAAPNVSVYIDEAKKRMTREKNESQSWTSAHLLVKEFMEQLETDQEIISICAAHRVILLRDLDMSQFGYREQTSALKIMRYAIGDYLFTQLREFEFHLIAELETSMHAI